MTIKDYFILAKPTLKSFIRIVGLIATGIAVFFAIGNSITTKEWHNPILMFIYCCIGGNLFGVLMCIIAFFGQFNDVNALFKFYNLIPNSIKEDFGLQICLKSTNFRKSFPEFQIVGFSKNAPIHFDYSSKTKQAYLTIPIVMSHISDYQKKKKEIDKTHEFEQIILSGMGVRKIIDKRKWKHLCDEDIYDILRKMYRIAEKENLTIFQYYERINWK